MNLQIKKNTCEFVAKIIVAMLRVIKPLAIKTKKYIVRKTPFVVPTIDGKLIE
jgi:hypothetical protein